MTNLPDDIIDRLQSCTTLPDPSAVTRRIIELAKDPQPDLATVSDAISIDPATVTKVICIANASACAKRRQILNLRQALIVLGLNATLTATLGLTLIPTLRNYPTRNLDAKLFWRRALLSGTWGKLLAVESGRRDAEEIFLAALLQDIGMLAIDHFAPEIYQDIDCLGSKHGQIARHEQTHLRTDHAQVGAWLLESWDMPQPIRFAIRHSHDISAVGSKAELKALTRIVSHCSPLSSTCLGNPSPHAIRVLGQDIHRHLGIPPNRLAELFDTIGEQIPVAESIFEMDLFDGAHLQDVSAMAGEILTILSRHERPESFDLHHLPSRPDYRKSGIKSKPYGTTKVYNRDDFEAALSDEYESAKKHKWPLSIIFVHLDRFGQINENHGSRAALLMLQEVSSLLTDSLRETDVVAHYGADEFVVLLPGGDAKEAEHVAERLVTEARTTSINAGGSASIAMTLSLGIATLDATHKFSTPGDLLSAADEALLHSKCSGRNKHTTHASIKAA